MRLGGAMSMRARGDEVGLEQDRVARLDERPQAAQQLELALDGIGHRLRVLVVFTANESDFCGWHTLLSR